MPHGIPLNSSPGEPVAHEKGLLVSSSILLYHKTSYHFPLPFSVEKSSYDLVNHQGGGSGGYLEHVIRHAAKEMYGHSLRHIEYKILRNQDFQEVTLELEGKPAIKMALAYGFRNIQNIVQKVKRGRKVPYHFVEIMACPSGCNNGGGQIRPAGEETPKELLGRVSELYSSLKTVEPNDVTGIKQLYTEWLGGSDSNKARKMLHTKYHEVEKMTNALTIKW
ncbi:cytosolic Fe-S cluster assembly factor narfl-like [Gigantopelta aegis]|uniref:cytosolic Fe-S cluster assembly factor narfl-like n=1 Tax=Gigantopelta aegis TaxID=1735272 RepID=UPI001B88ACD5|nr:cytosolic Fe-S cluster assembly factor narfl-like [Gigantopelta aegis]